MSGDCSPADSDGTRSKYSGPPEGDSTKHEALGSMCRVSTQLSYVSVFRSLGGCSKSWRSNGTCGKLGPPQIRFTSAAFPAIGGLEPGLDEEVCPFILYGFKVFHTNPNHHFGARFWLRASLPMYPVLPIYPRKGLNKSQNKSVQTQADALYGFTSVQTNPLDG